MNDAGTILTRDPFGLAPADYWKNPHRNMADVAWNRVGEGIAGVVLGGPATLDVDLRATLPMVAFHSDTLTGLIERPFHRSILVASRIDRVDLRAGTAVEAPEQRSAAGKAEPGFAGEPHDLELRSLLALPWAPAEWIVTLLMCDRPSNRVVIRLQRGALRYVDPEVERVRAGLRERRPPLTVHPPIGDPAVVYGAAPDDVPAEPGITLGAGKHLHIAFRLRTSPADVLAEGDIRAVVPVWLVITGERSLGPYVMPLHLPSFEEVEEGVATGSAVIDVFRDPIFASMPPQTFFVYAFSGGVMGGPAAMERTR